MANCRSSDIIKGFEAANKVDLEDCIDSDNGLLDRLGDRDIISNDEINRLDEIKEYRSRNRKILRKLKENINSSSKEFIKALCDDEQDHIAKFIVTAGCETNSDERLLPRELRKVINDNMFCLEWLIDTEKLELLHHLVRAGCITYRHRDRVIKSEPHYKAYELLIIIQRRRYRDFLKFLKCQEKGVANILEKGGVTEIKIQIREEQGNKRKIVAEMMKQMRGYVDAGDEHNLDGDRKKWSSNILQN